MGSFCTISVSAASVLLMSMVAEASACGCAKDTAQVQFSNADLVVKGRMKTVTFGIDLPTSEPDTLARSARGEFEIEKVLKGTLPEKTISIYTGSGLGDCGRLGDFLTAAYYYRDEKFGVIELGLTKGDFAGQAIYYTTICDYAKTPRVDEESKP